MSAARCLVMLIAFVSSLGLSCEDTVPGALPAGFWGGVIEPFRETKGEARDSDKNTGEAQFFFEAVYQDKQVRLYPLAIQPPKTSVFTKVQPREFSELEARVEFPWEGKVQPLPVSLTDEAIVASLDSQNVHRVVVHLRATHRGKTKFTNLQIENGD